MPILAEGDGMPFYTKNPNWFFNKIGELAVTRNLGHVGIRTVMVRTSDWVHYASCVFAPPNLLSGDTDQLTRMIYPQVALLSKEIPLRSITSYDDIFTAMQTWDDFGTYPIARPRPSTGDISIWFPGSHNQFTELPVWTFTAGNQPEVRPHDEPLLAPHLPSYQDTVEAASVWLCDPSISFNRYPIYTCRFLLTTSSAYIKNMYLEVNHALKIRVAQLIDQEDLVLQLMVKKTDGSVDRNTLSVTEEDISFPFPRDVAELCVYLIDQNGEPHDFFEETPHRSTWGRSVLKAQPESSNGPKIVGMPKSEGPTTELREGMPQNVFIVHGHDEVMRKEVARFIREIGYTPVVLHERPNLGRTIIEKFEQEAAGIGFAIILLTPDDFGASAADKAELNPRARQNVILELGYFVGKLGRQRVCSLYKGGVEIPSDILGVLYIEFDVEGAWKPQLIREMEAAGMAVETPPILSAQARESDRAVQVPLLPNLRMPKAEVKEKLTTQIEKGREIANRGIRTKTGLQPALVAQEDWNSYNMELLSRCFDSPVLAEKYKEVTTTPNATYQRASRGKTIMRSEIERAIRLLTSILQRLELVPDPKE